MKRKKVPKYGIRIPVAPPTRVHKTKKDYKRKKLAVNKIVPVKPTQYLDDYWYDDWWRNDPLEGLIVEDCDEDTGDPW